jgi:hypothetical protein
MSTPGSFHPIRHDRGGDPRPGDGRDHCALCPIVSARLEGQGAGPRPNPPSAIPSPVPGLSD